MDEVLALQIKPVFRCTAQLSASHSSPSALSGLRVIGLAFLLNKAGARASFMEACFSVM